MFRAVKRLQKIQRQPIARAMNISTLGPSPSPISGKAIAAELEMAVLKKLKSNAEQVGTALVDLDSRICFAHPCTGRTATRRLRLGLIQV